MKRMLGLMLVLLAGCGMSVRVGDPGPGRPPREVFAWGLDMHDGPTGFDRLNYDPALDYVPTGRPYSRPPLSYRRYSPDGQQEIVCHSTDVECRRLQGEIEGQRRAAEENGNDAQERARKDAYCRVRPSADECRPPQE